MKRSESAAADIELVPWNSVPRDDVLDLVRLCLGPGPTRTPEFFAWKHDDSPFGPSPGLVAVVRGRPVALRMFLRWQWSAAERRIDAVRAVDTVTHPEWRRRGLFRRLTLALLEQMDEEGVSFVFNTPNPRSEAGYLRMDWRRVGRIPLRVRPRRPLRALRRRRLGRSGLDLQLAAPSGTVLGILDRPEVQQFIEMGDPESARLHTRVTLPYLRWRYGAVPGMEYHMSFIGDGEAGVLVVARVRTRNGARELALTEFIVRGDREVQRGGRRLVGELASAVDADYVIAMQPQSAAGRRVLSTAGFLPPMRVGPKFAVRHLAGEVRPDPHEVRAWQLTIGDLELF